MVLYDGTEGRAVIIEFILFLAVIACWVYYSRVERFKKGASTPVDIPPVLRRLPDFVIRDRIMNATEKRILWDLRRVLRGSHMVHAQVSLNRVLSAVDYRDFRLISAKSLDFLITDLDGRPLVAVEFNGRGHYSNDWERRDGEKGYACEEAGLPLLWVEKWDGEELARVISTVRGIETAGFRSAVCGSLSESVTRSPHAA